jgi:hypothetical protein
MDGRLLYSRRAAAAPGARHTVSSARRTLVRAIREMACRCVCEVSAKLITSMIFLNCPRAGSRFDYLRRDRRTQPRNGSTPPFLSASKRETSKSGVGDS